MNEKRIFGLDVMRSLALMIVVLIHSEFFLARNFDTSFIAKLPDGVELFFVLSGFLIGRFIITDFVENDQLSASTLLNFFQRRWFRTLPNYYLFLVINIVLIYFGLIPGVLNKYLITYPFFLQNFHKPFDFLFWESWSLSLEEWFYLSFPLFLFAALKVRMNISKKSRFLLLIVLFIVGSTLLRLIQYEPNLVRDLFFRKIVIMRLDACIYGVLMAYLIHYKPTIFQSRSRNLFLLTIGIIGFFILNRLIQNDLFSKTFYFNLQGVFVMLWIPFLNKWNYSGKLSNSITYLSLISFVIYLTHLPSLHILNHFVPKVGNFLMLLFYLGFWIFNLIIGLLLYTYFERPITLKRERYTELLKKSKRVD
jgi:peptidoglycan/LPS O-acetylase OafA/YrhL